MCSKLPLLGVCSACSRQRNRRTQTSDALMLVSGEPAAESLS